MSANRKSRETISPPNAKTHSLPSSCKNPFFIHPAELAMEGKNGPSPFPAALRTPEQPHPFRVSPNDTKSLFIGTLRLNMTRDFSGISPLEKKIQPSFISSKKRRLSRQSGKAACSCGNGEVTAGKQRPCPEGTWRSDASAGRRRPRPLSQDPGQPSSRWKPSFHPRPSGPLHGRP